MEGVSKGPLKSMLPSSSRLSPLAKPFSLKKGHDQDHGHWQHMEEVAFSVSEGHLMSYSGFSGLPFVPSLDLDNYLKKETGNEGSGTHSRSCEKGSVSASLIGPQPYSSVVSCILDVYGPDKEGKVPDLFDCAQTIISSGSSSRLHSPDSGNKGGLQKDKSGISRLDGLHFKGKDAANSPAFRVDTKKGHRTSKISKLLDEACSSVNTDTQMKFRGAEHEPEDAKFPKQAFDVTFPFEDLVALDWDYSLMTKGTSFNTFGVQSPAISTNHDCESPVSCQSWVNQLVSSPGKHVVPLPQNIDNLQTQAYLLTRSDMDNNVGVDTSKPPEMDSLPVVKCNSQLTVPCIVRVDAEKEAEGIESFGNLPLQPGRIKVGHIETEKDDSDVDSPCWKGLSFHQSHSRTYGASDVRNPESKLVTRNSLNPLAPQFFPQNAKSWSYEDSKLVAEDLFSFWRPSSGPAEALPEKLNFDEDLDPVKYSPLWPPARSVLSDHVSKLPQKGDEKFDLCLDQPLLEESCFKYTGEAEMLTGLARQESIMADPTVKKAVSVPLLAAPNAAGTLSQQKKVSVLSKPAVISNTHFNESAAINMSLNIDEEVLVDTMHDLSKLLLTKCHEERSFDKLNHKRIRAMISNLLICIGGVHAKRDSTQDLDDLCILDNPCKYVDLLNLQKNDWIILRKRAHEASGFSAAATRTHQSLEKAPSALCVDEAKTSQQAHLYQTLWLEAQAELHSLKSKASTSYMKS